MSKIIENYLYKNDKRYSIVFKDRITGFLKDSFDSILSGIEQSLQDKIKIGFYEGAAQGLTDSQEIALKLLKEGKVTGNDMVKFEKGITGDNGELLACYKTLKLFIDIEKSDKELAKDLKLDVEKNLNFWKEQDLEYCKEKFIFFRSKLA